jgi:hypothetical protein
LRQKTQKSRSLETISWKVWKQSSRNAVRRSAGSGLWSCSLVEAGLHGCGNRRRNQCNVHRRSFPGARKVRLAMQASVVRAYAVPMSENGSLWLKLFHWSILIFSLGFRFFKTGKKIVVLFWGDDACIRYCIHVGSLPADRSRPCLELFFGNPCLPRKPCFLGKQRFPGRKATLCWEANACFPRVAVC